MARMFEVINPGEERQARLRRKLVFFVVLLSAGLFYYPHVKSYRSRWEALSAARSIAEYIQQIKTRAILEQKPYEVRFSPPAVLEVLAVPGCGVGGQKQRVATRSLAEFATGLEYVTGSRLSAALEPGMEHTMLSRICYDPIQGSSLNIDGVLHGGIVLGIADRETGELQWARLLFSGASADLEIE